MKPLKPHRVAPLPAEQQPLLLVVIDTEEEFDWRAPHDRNSRSVDCIAEQYHAQLLFARHDLVPTYVVDHPVAATPAAAAVFRKWAHDGTCIVGAHLHPWVNPPEREAVNARNSYPGNLPLELEREKLAVLTDTIAENIGQRPNIYKAGRYGLGPNSARVLADLGYEIDLSVVPGTDFGGDGGPDFRGLPHDPFWFGAEGGLFEIPLTRGFPGWLGRWGEPVYNVLGGGVGQRLRLPGVLSRLGMVERIALTPEGVSLEDCKRVTEHLLAAGRRIFTFAYHSSTLLPGGSPYVRTAAARQRFLDKMDAYIGWFREVVGGRGTTPYEIRALCDGAASHTATAPVPPRIAAQDIRAS